MSRSRYSVLAIATITVAACNAAPPEAGNAATAAPVEITPVAANETAPAAAVSDPSGSYSRTDPSNGTLTIAKAGANWTLNVGAAGMPDRPGIAADCVLVASGPLVGGRIVGKLVRTEDTAYDAVAEEDTGGTITAIVGVNSVVLEEQGASSKHCGLGSDLTGTYTKG